MLKKLVILLSIGLVLAGCNGKDPVPEQTGKEYKVAVIFPKDEWESAEPVVKWAQEEARKAYPGVILKLEWIDEESAGIASKVKDITHDNTYAAVIGPEYSVNARLVAKESLSYRVPVLLPMVSSTEFQRIYAETNKKDPNIFCLAQSDAAQCEAVIAKAKQSKVKSFFMLLSENENDYTASFEQYFMFLCKEAGMLDAGYAKFSSKEQLAAIIDDMTGRADDFGAPGWFFVPSSLEEMLAFDEAVAKYKGTEKFWPTFCADIAHAPQLEGKLKGGPYEGFSLGASQEFEKKWNNKFGTALPGGYAQLYDCVTLVALAANIVERGLSETVREALESIVFGPNTNLASGNIHYIDDAPIAPREVIYQNWKYDGGKFSIISSATHNIEKGWDWSAMKIDEIDEKDIPDDSDLYAPLKDHRAFIVATSTGWSNYRHQADALAMYQMLKYFGYSDDQIVLVMEDDVAYSAMNPYPGKDGGPGEVRVWPDGPDQREGAVIDYKLSELDPVKDLPNIFAGKVTEKTPKVIDGGIGTNVFVFWSGHGVKNDELKWGDKTIGSDTIHEMLMGAKSNFRKMFFVMDTCYSGSIPQYCNATGLLFLCSAAAGEPSHADIYDEKCGTYLSNGFTRAFRSAVEANPNISLDNLYKEVARETSGSHAGVYNYLYYGSLKNNSFKEYTVK